MRNWLALFCCGAVLACATTQTTPQQSDPLAAATQQQGDPTRASNDANADCPVLDVNVSVSPELDAYMRHIQTIVMKKWKAPFSRKTRNKKGWVEIRFKIQSNGTIIEANVAHQSGIAEFDWSALRAIHLSSPLPPLPSEMTCTPANATYRFYYNMAENQ